MQLHINSDQRVLNYAINRLCDYSIIRLPDYSNQRLLDYSIIFTRVDYSITRLFKQTITQFF